MPHAGRAEDVSRKDGPIVLEEFAAVLEQKREVGRPDTWL
jgi:hypothetical protein